MSSVHDLTLRLRRLRRTDSIRRMVKETTIDPSSLVCPIFVRTGSNITEPIESMPGVYRYSIDRCLLFIHELVKVGINNILLFGIPGTKDEVGSEAYSHDGVIPLAVREIKDNFPHLTIITDVCLCEYTTHGHCGIIHNNQVDNDATLLLLQKASVEYAKAGADIVAPSAMMDGQVKAIRMALDQNGLTETIIMSYSAKFASSFYGPFRDAAMSAPRFGDRSAYQMQYSNRREALREIRQDIKEGADIVMVKPALAYLDVIHEARRRFDLPIAAYNVSGEYALIKIAAKNGIIDEKKMVIETLTSIKRAGADIIITYFALDFAKWLKGEN
ncbi:MAG: porphobilinogen synthase [Conexivisphaerales archaeon]